MSTGSAIARWRSNLASTWRRRVTADNIRLVGQLAGIDVVALAERASRDRPQPISPDELSRWLLRQRLAERLPDGRLAPTPTGRQLGAAMRRLEGNAP